MENTLKLHMVDFGFLLLLQSKKSYPSLFSYNMLSKLTLYTHMHKEHKTIFVPFHLKQTAYY